MTANLKVYLPSTWRGPIGKLLTDAAIRRYEQAGYYGRERIIHCCRCNGTDSVLDTGSGLFFCKNCRRQLSEQQQREKLKELRRTLRNLDAFI